MYRCYGEEGGDLSADQKADAAPEVIEAASRTPGALRPD